MEMGWGTGNKDAIGGTACNWRFVKLLFTLLLIFLCCFLCYYNSLNTPFHFINVFFYLLQAADF